jgi:N-acylneuraminate cytidylyltransferase
VGTTRRHPIPAILLAEIEIMEVLAIIPARGGSKGIPRKNIHPLAGKPLIAYSIEQALLSRHITRVVVSTDDPQIGSVAAQYGAEVVWRPVEISGDMASSESALLYTLNFLAENEDYHPDLLVFLQCTSPLTIMSDIDGTITALIESKADTALSVSPFHYFLWKSDQPENGRESAVGINHDKSMRQLRQEQKPQFIETGAVYAMRVDGFLQQQHRFFGRTAMYVMPHERRLEIDEPVDFKVAEVLLKENAERMASGPPFPDPIQALILDFDGVFTDNKVIVFQDGSEAVLCDRSDGWGIAQLKSTGLPILILSTEKNPVVQARANKLDIPCIQGSSNKWDSLQKFISGQGIDPKNVVYVGNDLNDLPCIVNVGYSIAVADAHPVVLDQVDFVLKNRGGSGAIREVCDMLLNHFNHQTP